MEEQKELINPNYNLLLLEGSKINKELLNKLDSKPKLEFIFPNENPLTIKDRNDDCQQIKAKIKEECCKSNVNDVHKKIVLNLKEFNFNSIDLSKDEFQFLINTIKINPFLQILNLKSSRNDQKRNTLLVIN